MALLTCSTLKTQRGLNTVALSGGVWQNRTLLNLTIMKLHAAGFEVLLHRRLPPNDGCIALGQVMVAAHQKK
jgi:hydrogenase maturation protein HypF